MEVEENLTASSDSDENDESYVSLDESHFENVDEVSFYLAKPRFLDHGFNRGPTLATNKTAVMQAVSLSARKKYLKDFLEQLLVLRSRAVEENFRKGRTLYCTYVCGGCSMSYPNQSLLLDHTTRGTSRLIWRCTICWLSFETQNICEAALHGPDYHVNDSGKFPLNIPLELIGVGPQDETLLLNEVCPECRKGVGSIITHLWSEYPNDVPHHCPYCYVFFTRNSCRYNLHVRVHKNMAPFRCPDCSKIFKNGVELQCHLVKHCRHMEQLTRYKCSVCDLIFLTDDLLRQHIFSLHNRIVYKCHLCPAQMHIASEKNEHYDNHHRQEVSKAVMRRVKNFIAEHKCAICGTKNLNGFKYERHIGAHFKCNQFKINIYACDCGFSTSFKALYLQHKSTPCITDFFSALKNSSAAMKKCITCFDIKFYNGMEPFTCEKCFYYGGSENIFSYRCKLCSKHIFYSMEYVIEHLCTQHGKKTLEIPHPHTYVTRVLYDKDALDHNLEFHSGPKTTNISVKREESVKIKIEQEDQKNVHHNLDVFPIQIKEEDSNKKDFSCCLKSEPGRIEPTYDSSIAEQSFKCCVCSVSFANMDLLSNHSQTDHAENNRIFCCSECSATFNSLKSFTVHLQTHGITDAEDNTRNQNDAEDNTRNQNDAEDNTRNQNDAEDNTRNQNDAEDNTRHQNDAEDNTRNQNDAEGNTRHQNDAESVETGDLFCTVCEEFFSDCLKYQQHLRSHGLAFLNELKRI